jgi:hypothetical protein
LVASIELGEFSSHVFPSGHHAHAHGIKRAKFFWQFSGAVHVAKSIGWRCAKSVEGLEDTAGAGSLKQRIDFRGFGLARWGSSGCQGNRWIQDEARIDISTDLQMRRLSPEGLFYFVGNDFRAWMSLKPAKSCQTGQWRGIG